MSDAVAFGTIEGSIGKYRLLGALAEGKWAQLYLAEQTGPRGFAKIVALKRVLPHLSARPEFRELFLNAAVVEARLEHPNILATYELGEAGGEYFMSMEYLPGEDLETILEANARRAIPFAVAAAISLQAARALSYAHDQVVSNGARVCIVHRRVKPSNVAVTYQGDVKVLDFGMARVRTGTGRTQDDEAYAAPEMVAGETLDARTDVFCLGAVLWECLTGQPRPKGELIAPSKLEPSVPEALDRIVLAMLARDRAKRPAGGTPVAVALERFLAWHREASSREAIARWMESVFGARRARLKMAIAQGLDPKKHLAELNPPREQPEPTALVAPEMRKAWSTDLGGPSMRRSASSELWFKDVVPETPSFLPAHQRTEDTIPDDPPRAIGAISALTGDLVEPVKLDRAKLAAAALSLFVIAAAAISIVAIDQGDEGPVRDAARATTSLEITSDPAGAHILIDGEPTGLQTPAVLRNLSREKVIEISLTKWGFATEKQTVDLGAEKIDRREFRLKRTLGIVRFIGLSPKNVLYVDDRRVDPSTDVELPVGRHTVRVETGHELIDTRTIEVAGERLELDLRAKK